MTSYVLAEEEVVLGFSLIGVDGCVPRNREDALKAFTTERLPRTLFMVSEEVAAWLGPETLNALCTGILIQVIPGVRTPPKAREHVEALVLSALGIKG